MTTLITARSLSKAHGAQVLFDHLSFSLTDKSRTGLIGPNGAGKSSLIKILAGKEPPDSGTLFIKQNLKIGYASQLPEFPSMPIDQFLIEGFHGEKKIHAATRAKILLSKAEFKDPLQHTSSLSGGWKKRLDIVKALMEEPDFLLLDEPTNHLDLEGILWLETFLNRQNTPFLVISHDRYFLQNVANEIMELNKCYPNGIFVSKGNMSTFTRQKQEWLHSLEKEERKLSFKVKEELNWLRTSPKARTTKSQSRKESAYRLLDDLEKVKQKRKTDVAGIDFTSSERATRKLLVAKNLGKSLGEKRLFHNLDITLSSGSCLGILGKNGTGKTTLLKILAKEIPQDMGTIKYADDLKIVYFDQLRESIAPDITLKEALCPLGDTVNYRGQQIHINAFSKRFLFNDKLNLPVRFLSGGEKARILIAKLMLKPADILFLDEPTNDLDIPTLEVIEESLQNFPGAVVLISHDRCLMDKLCDTVLGITEDKGHCFFASFSQWESFYKEEKKTVSKKTSALQPSNTKKPLSYNEKKELETIEATIAEAEKFLESLLEELKDKTGDLSFFKKIEKGQKRVEMLYLRWQELIDRSN